MHQQLVSNALIDTYSKFPIITTLNQQQKLQQYSKLAVVRTVCRLTETHARTHAHTHTHTEVTKLKLSAIRSNNDCKHDTIVWSRDTTVSSVQLPSGF